MTAFVSTDAPPESAYTAAFLVTPSDSVDLPNGACRAVLVDSNGSHAYVRVTLVNNDDGTYVTLPVANHDTKQLCVKRVWATGTTATSVFALY